jgi:hypothetical protein
MACGTECVISPAHFAPAPDRTPKGQDNRLGSRKRRERVAARQRRNLLETSNQLSKARSMKHGKQTRSSYHAHIWVSPVGFRSPNHIERTYNSAISNAQLIGGRVP